MQKPNFKNGAVEPLSSQFDSQSSVGLTESWLTSAEAAAYTRLSSSTLAKLRLSGGGPRYTKIGRKVLYARANLDAWMTAHARTSTSDRSTIAKERGI
jgi:excisionase family DNA binding protein